MFMSLALSWLKLHDRRRGGMREEEMIGPAQLVYVKRERERERMCLFIKLLQLPFQDEM